MQEELKEALKEVDALDGIEKGVDNAASREYSHMWVACLVVTPTRVYCKGPRLEQSNRMLRHFRLYRVS